MLSFLGYNFLADGNAIDPVPTDVQSIGKVELYNGIIDFFEISHAVDNEYSRNEPEWNDDTSIIVANFDNTTQGGYLPDIELNFNQLFIVRNDGNGDDWKVLTKIDVTDAGDLGIDFNDYTAVSGTNIRYGLITGNDYILEPQFTTQIMYNTTSTNINFPYTYICNQHHCYSLYIALSLTNTVRVRPSAIIETLEGKYPFVIRNSQTNYQKGGISCRFFDHKLIKGGFTSENRNAIRKAREEFIQYCLDGSIKLYKDWNGNLWVISIYDNGQIDYVAMSDNALAEVTFNYVEVGSNDAKSMADLGIIGGYIESNQVIYYGRD